MAEKLSRNRYFTPKNKNNNDKHMLTKALSLIAFLIIGIGAAYGAKMYFEMQATVKHVYHPTNKPTQVATKIAKSKPISILLLGVDQGIENRHDKGNSDTMILITLNPKKQKATMTSIPRDLLVQVYKNKQTKGNIFRVNSAYGAGGSKAASATVSKALNVPIDYYAEVDMAALENAVNAVGGVTVNVPFSFTYNTHFTKGKMHLNGKQALDYARMRKEDPKGDYGRQMRQRQIIVQLVNKGLELDSTSEYKRLLDLVDKYVKTDLTFDDMLAIATKYRKAVENIKSDYVHGHDANINGASIQVGSTKELQRISNLNRSNLDLPHETLNNDETQLNARQKGLNWDNPATFENYKVN